MCSDNEYKLNLINKFISDESKSIFFISISNSVCNLLPQNFPDFKVIDLQNNFSPYKPFLNMLSQSKPELEKVKDLTYSVQTESFTSFLQNGYATERYDLPIPNEQIYESKRFAQSIIELLKKYNNSNYLILNAQNIFENSINVLNEIKNQKFQHKIIFCFNSDFTEFYSPKVTDFIEKNNSLPNFLYFNRTKDQNLENLILPSTEQLLSQSLTSFEEIFKSLRNNRIFMCFEQLKLVVDFVSNNLSSFYLTKENTRILKFEIAVAYFQCQCPDQAVLLFTELSEQEDDAVTTACYYYLAQIFFLKKSNEIAQSYINNLAIRFKKESESPYQALTAMLEYQFTKRSDQKTSIEKYERALELLEKYGLINNYISTGLSVAWNLSAEVYTKEVIDTQVEKCFQFAKQIDNQHLFSSACHWKGIILSHYGDSENSMKWNLECNRIRTQIGDLQPILNIRNGLSYEYTCRCQFEEAYNLLNETIPNLYSINDYSSIIDALKNVAFALFYARNLKSASDIFNLISHFLTVLKMDENINNSFLPSKNDILIFTSIINISKNDFIHAEINYNNVTTNNNFTTSENLPFLDYINAALLANENKIPQSKEVFYKCIQGFNSFKSIQINKILFLYYEYAILLKNLNQPEESLFFFNEGKKLAQQNNLQWFIKDSIAHYIGSIKNFSPLAVNLEFLEQKCEKEVLLTSLHRRIYDYQFLNKIRSNGLQNEGLKNYINSCVQSIYDYTTSDSVFFCELIDDEYKTSCLINRTEHKTIEHPVWLELFKQSENRETCHITYYPEFNLYFGNISKFDFKFGIAFISSESSVPQETINMLNLAFTVIQSQITIYKQNENLLFLSSIDQLSLLNNRHSLQQFLTLESDKIRRLKNKKDFISEVTIGFIDLDNFKFYNDTFGHGCGDLLIKCFSKLLKNSCRQIDFIARFGGDEFALIFLDTTSAQANVIYERIKKNLEQANFFIPELKKFLNKKEVQIPQNRYLGFSMGICSNLETTNPLDLNLTLEMADKALYHAKENNKGSCCHWKDIK